MSRWICTFTTLKPENPSQTWEVGIHQWHVELLRKQGHEAPYARIALVKEVLDRPIALFQGWSRPDQDDSFVYVGNPTHDFRSLTIETPAPPNKLFLVFVLPDGTIDMWGWREKAAGSSSIPEDVNGKLIWPPEATT